MSAERKNQKGPESKKPKATFGDVMLGIPSGREGQGDAAPAPEPVTAKGPKVRKASEKKSEGPLVVVRRASGAVETRTAAAPEPTAVAPETTEAAESSQTHETHEAKEPRRAKHAEPIRSALFEEVPESQSFAEMFEASAKAEGGVSRKQFRVGEKIKGKIFQLGADTAFVSLGGKSEAMIDLNELKDAEGILRSGVGDEVEAYVIESGARGIFLSKGLPKGAASLGMLAEAKASGMPVEGLVLAVNKGGFEVAVGDTRAFCPMSQMELRFVEKPEEYIGERFKFRVSEVRERKVVLSRRAILEEEQAALAAETRKSLTVGAVLKGRVTNVRDFGVFVDLGGIEGMVPVSELSHTRVSRPGDLVKAGDQVEVEILKIEGPQPNSPDKAKHKERITLSMRSRQEDPFNALVAELKEGSKTKGKVMRLQPFGAFVELKPGVDGLIHVSALSDRRIAHPRDAVKVGQEVTVVVEKIDPAEKRIALRLWNEAEDRPVGGMAGAPEVEEREKEEKPERAPRPKMGQVVTAKVERIEPFGLFVAYPGGTGLIPSRETGTERGADLRRAFQLGQELRASILEVQGGKVKLSLTEAQRAEERADLDAWKKNQPKGGGGKGFGTFADLLKGKKL